MIRNHLVTVVAILLFGIAFVAATTHKDFFFSLSSKWVEARIESTYPIPSMDE